MIRPNYILFIVSLQVTGTTQVFPALTLDKGDVGAGPGAPSNRSHASPRLIIPKRETEANPQHYL